MDDGGDGDYDDGDGVLVLMIWAAVLGVVAVMAAILLQLPTVVFQLQHYPMEFLGNSFISVTSCTRMS